VRFAFAISALVLAGVLLLLGIGQRTFLAGPREISYAVTAPMDADYSVLSASELEAVSGQPNLVVTGADAFVATGSTLDVSAWVEPFAHATLSVDAEKGEVVTQKTAPAGSPEFLEKLSDEERAAIDPRGSDLWFTELQGPGRLPLEVSENQSILISGDSDASILWVKDRRTPWAGPLLAAGGFFAILGGILYLLAVDHNRRGLGPQRGHKGPFRGLRNLGSRRAGSKRTGSNGTSTAGKPAEAGETATLGGGSAMRRAALPALGLAIALGVSGCAPSYWPSLDRPANDVAPEGEVETNVAPVPVTQPQIDRIVADIVAVAATGDESLDAKGLGTRFRGDALAQRAANYKIRKSVPKYEVQLPRITDEQLGYELVQSTEGWPRTLFITLASESPTADEKKDAAADEASGEESAPPASPSLALLLTQQNPVENFHVSRIFALRGGITMPEAAPSDEGTALLAPDLQSLALPPSEVGTAYAKILAGDRESERASLFDLEDDNIMAKSGSSWVKAAKAAAKKDGNNVKYSVKVAQSESPVLSLSTGVGGALVTTTLTEQRIESQSGDYRPKAVGAVTAVSGLKGAQKRIVSSVAHQLLFYVPSGTSGEKIQLLGYTTELVGAKK